jgi:hypothetical protein
LSLLIAGLETWGGCNYPKTSWQHLPWRRKVALIFFMSSLTIWDQLSIVSLQMGRL